MATDGVRVRLIFKHNFTKSGTSRLCSKNLPSQKFVASSSIFNLLRSFVFNYTDFQLNVPCAF